MAIYDPVIYNKAITIKDIARNLIEYVKFTGIFQGALNYEVSNGTVAYLPMSVVIIKAHRIADDAFCTDREIEGCITYL